jgi:hypothetical protein
MNDNDKRNLIHELSDEIKKEMRPLAEILDAIKFSDRACGNNGGMHILSITRINKMILVSVGDRFLAFDDESFMEHITKIEDRRK